MNNIHSGYMENTSKNSWLIMHIFAHIVQISTYNIHSSHMENTLKNTQNSPTDFFMHVVIL